MQRPAAEAGGLQAIVADVPEPLVCMTTHGRSGVAHTLFGSVAEDVLRRVGVPMLLVGPRVRLELAGSFDTAVGQPVSVALKELA
jgi:hypothetical protein